MSPLLAQMTVFGEASWAPVRGGRLDLAPADTPLLVKLVEPRTRTVDVAILEE